jgi:hypothetical protein
MQFDIDIFVLQEAMQVRDLRHHADRAQDGERRSHNFVRHAGHHVTAAGRDFINRHG